MAGSSTDVTAVADLLSKTKVEQFNEVSFAGQGLKLNNAEDAAEIIKAIDESKDMQSLRLDGNTVGVDAAKAIAKALEKKAEFERARWSDMFTGRLRSEIPPALKHLGAAIMTSGAHLVELDLSDNAFGPDGVKAVRELLESSACYSIQELRFNNNGLGIGGKLMAEALIVCHKKSSAEGKPLALKVFIAGRNRLENPGATALAEAFKTIGTLEEVAMPQNGINHEGITALAQAFQHSPNLRIVNLNDNTFTAKGAISMAKGLKNLRKLEVINFGDCLVRTEGAEALADTLKDGIPQLQELNLSFGEIGREAAVQIAEAMETKAFLKSLELNGNCFGDEGCELIKGVMEANDRLDALGTLSDDEGDEDEDDSDEYEDVDDDDEEEETGEDQGEVVDDPALQVRGTQLTPRSPREGEIKENVVPATAAEFLSFPTADKLLGIGNDRGEKILKQLGADAEDETVAVQVLVKVASVWDNKRESVKKAIYQSADAIMSGLFSKEDCKTETVGNNLLVHLGLLKDEDKTKPMADPTGLLLTLEHVVKQDYFPRHIIQFFTVFLSRPHEVIDSCIMAKHQLMQTLYKL
ncbi:ran GTPase-activating protein 1-like [Amphiura filiformis]|uniref:ran GTPase-activating protein 1-like n=1 Tax=Amphiura filiformis TaxID=82378 RepID=UPI003B224295